MKASALDLRRKMSEVIRALDHNESVTIFYRGKKKGILIPAKESKGQEISVKEHPSFGMWKDREDMKDVNRLVRNLRKGRIDDF